MKSIRHLKFDADLNEEKRMLKDLVVPCLQARFSTCFSSIKSRMKFIKRLNHHDFFNPLYRNEIRSCDDTVSSILDMLEIKKAPENCYVISTNSNMDGKRMPLREALNLIHCNQQGSVICCIPGKLLYYEGEFKTRYIVEKTV